VTRAQAATFIYRLAKTPEVGKTDVFTDVDADSYYADAVSWAYAEGITTGTTETTFSPDNSCIRAQIVTFLYRYFEGK
ncbi:MAG: S-layer homology domain-containing protein, partial [Oscillospiraceae bacterium]|nr:S-layer homology domain-containing protein [Oscillospiraceae bacterium]